MNQASDTIAAIATPPGQGGVGIVKLSGPDSGRILTAIARIKPRHRQCRYATFHAADGQALDRGLALFFQAPDSHTGEDVAELHGHGGPVVMNMLLQRVLAAGARYARPGEFSERAFLNNKLDLLQAEAVADLIRSASEQAAVSAVRAMQGVFSSLIKTLANQLVELRVFTEALLDFPEEELDPALEAQLQTRLQDCRQQLADICARAQAGRMLTEGLQVALIGKPNVGKSSLLNCLAEAERAIVSPEPGTTRDTVEQDILLAGIPLRVIDTAGMRATGNAVEQEGIRRAEAALQQADIVILIADAREDTPRWLQALDAQCGEHQRRFHVCNKIDLSGDAPGVRQGAAHTPTIYLSAKTGAGMEEFREALRCSVVGEQPAENAFVAHTRHIDALNKAAAGLEQAAVAFQQRRALELLAEDLSGAQRSLGIITGEFTPDDLLGEIFSRFCIGK